MYHGTARIYVRGKIACILADARLTYSATPSFAKISIVSPGARVTMAFFH